MDFIRVLSSVIIAAQSDTRDKEYLISWSQKIFFSEPLVFKDIYFLEWTSLFDF